MFRMGRNLLFVGVLGAAAGLPYAWSNTKFGKTLQGWWNGSGSEETAAASAGDALHAAGHSLQSAANSWSEHLAPYARLDSAGGAGGSADALAPQHRVAQMPGITGPENPSLNDLFRFDVLPAGVTQRWGRVSTTLADLDLEGMRVAVVTGGAPHDIAGSLTYYFDRQQQVQRISFQGHTGDPRQLVAMITEYHKLKPEPSLGAGLYMAKWNGVPKSALRIRHASIIRADEPNTAYEVTLELNRPGAGYGLSHVFEEELQYERQLRRW